MKRKIISLIILFLFILTSAVYSQNLNIKKGWNIFGAQEDKITMNQFKVNSNIVGVMKLKGNNGFELAPDNWYVWAADSNLQEQLTTAGFSKLYEIYSGEGFAVYANNDTSLNVSGMCETNFLPVATVSSDYKSGGYAIVDINNMKAYKNLNSYTIGGDDRSYYFDGYIFVVDAPNDTNVTTFYVYKINESAASLNEANAKTVVANYNINRQNPHSIAFKSLSKAYLTTYYDNSILIFNPLTGVESGTIDLSNYLYTSDNGTKNQYVAAEHMLLRGNKLFVSIDRARTYYGDTQPDKSMILVIDTNTDTVEKTIEVSYSPRSLQVYGDYLYFVSMGDYSSPIGKIYRINLENYKLDSNFIVSPVVSGNSTDYIKNFTITTEGSLYFVANSGWGKPYNVYRILNIDLYNDTSKTGLETTPVYSSNGYIPDIDFLCGKVVIVDRDGNGAIIFMDKDGNTTKLTGTELGYPPYKLGTDYNY